MEKTIEIDTKIAEEYLMTKNISHNHPTIVGRLCAELKRALVPELPTEEDLGTIRFILTTIYTAPQEKINLQKILDYVEYQVKNNSSPEE